MITASISQIEMVLLGDEIMITLRSRETKSVRSCNVSLQRAQELSLLLNGGAFHWVLNHEVDPGVTLQIENLHHERAWLGIAGACPHDAAPLVACIEAEMIAEIGNLLHDLVLAGGDALPESERVIHVRSVSYCYLDDEEDG